MAARGARSAAPSWPELDCLLFAELGVVQETGKKFWSTKDPGQQPFSYQAGVGQVIKGWDQGLLGMKLGEERQVARHTPTDA